MKTILVPYDFSKDAENAFDFARGLAAKTKHHLKLVHVIEIPTAHSLGTMGGAETGYEMNQIFVLELVEKRKKQMSELEAMYKNLGFSFSTKLVFGNPYAGISKEIAEIGADLVVMGSRGSSGLEELLIGSNTEKVVRHATCPVITIKDKRDPDNIKKIVFASDFQESSKKVVTKLKKLQEVLQAELFLVKINTPSMFENSRESLKNIHAFISENELQNVSVEIFNSSSEEEGIIEYAEDIDADMIALATHGRTGFLHLLSGSIAEDVVNHAQRPVWTMKVK
ncbi:universal stress protein [Rhodonellum psychrophilum GCM71 = DSM 17998]|uniref:Universal stress protein n=2 Tax=Rhodonellum TaxID=336827 RepID=U5BTV8_9BACT|nr:MULTISPECIES: universal stress protein [Rhodonellum]ERM80959.1 universal stress protein [Rhodonellum psychrophilum GCM71 = DSM 17998]MDO9554745.1 universal stress protein [Rhodonellum sp.]SDY82341.1 Nucleotide-binding universal stress protein, UspA family [Rhodonellum ikkaensis]